MSFRKILQKAGVTVANLKSHGLLHGSVVYEVTRKGGRPRAEVRLLTVSIKEALSGATRTMQCRRE